jgi:hypothetical protein
MSICKAGVFFVSYDDEEFRGKAVGDIKSVHLMSLPNNQLSLICRVLLQKFDDLAMLLYVDSQLLPHAIRLSFLYILA